MRPAPFYRPGRGTSPENGRKQTANVLFASWNAHVSASTISDRCSCFRLFGSFAWQIETPQRVAAHVLADLKNGGTRFESLANAWDAAQHDNGITWKTRKGRRTVLRSFVAWCIAHDAAPRGVQIASLVRDVPRGSVHERAEHAITTAIEQRRDRDAAIVMLAWETGLHAGQIRDLTVADLSSLDLSNRCERILRSVCGSRPSGAWVFPGRRMGDALSLAHVHGTIDRAGLPTPRELLKVRLDRLRALTGEASTIASGGSASPNFSDARTLAGET
jgi:integrase